MGRSWTAEGEQVNTSFARASSSGNARVWVICKHRRYTVRRSKVKSVEPCAKCVAGAKGNAE